MFSIPTELTLRFEDRVRQDNTEFSIRSIYFPNPVLSDSPRMCLVAMEPAVREYKQDSLKDEIREGYVNFVCTPEDIILHYCLYISSGSTFNYHITDLSKGAMTLAEARKRRRERYKNWLPLLKEELTHFRNPQLLSFGCGPESFLKKTKDFETLGYMMHHSRNNSWRFLKILNRYKQGEIPRDLHTKIKDFSDHLFDKIGYSARLRKKVVGDRFSSELKDWQKGMFLHYIETLSSIFQ